MRVGQMSVAHLANAIAMIERSINWRRHWLPRLRLEQTIRRLGMRSFK